MPNANFRLPPAAVQHMSETARDYLPPKLLTSIADSGVHSEEGFFGLGRGWYHTGTSASEVFLGHPGEADFYILDFGVLPTGGAAAQGHDIITQFELATDGVVVLNTFAEIAPGVSYSTVAHGVEPGARFEQGIDYALVRLEFLGQTPIQTQIADLGSLRFVDLV